MKDVSEILQKHIDLRPREVRVEDLRLTVDEYVVLCEAHANDEPVTCGAGLLRIQEVSVTLPPRHLDGRAPVEVVLSAWPAKAAHSE